MPPFTVVIKASDTLADLRLQIADATTFATDDQRLIGVNGGVAVELDDSHSPHDYSTVHCVRYLGGGGNPKANIITLILRLLPVEHHPASPADPQSRTTQARKMLDEYRDSVVKIAEDYAHTVSPTMATEKGKSVAATLLNHAKHYKDIVKKDAKAMETVVNEQLAMRTVQTKSGKRLASELQEEH